MLSYINKKSRIGIVISFLAALICLFKSSEAPEGYEYFWLVPLFYSLCLSLSRIRNHYFSFLGISILNIILFIRYVVAPLFSSLTGLYTHSRLGLSSSNNNEIAVFLLIMEMALLFLALNFASSSLIKVKERCVKNINIRKNNGVYILFASIGILGYFLFPAIKERINFLIVDEVEIYNLNSIASITFFLTMNAANLLFLWVLSRELYKKKNGKLSYKFIVLLFAFMSIIVVSSSSRLTILANGIAIIALLNFTQLLSKKSLNLLGVTTVIVILSITSLRLFGEGEILTFQNNATNYFDLQMVSDYLQAYFGGADLISAAVGVSENFSFLNQFGTFFNEIFSSIVFVRQIIPPSSASSTVLFNSLFGFTEFNSMILPTLGQGYMYFGIFGGPLFSVLLFFILYWAEKRLLTAEDIGVKYAFYIFTIWLAFFPMQNLNIIVSTTFNVFLPLYLFVVINKKINLKTLN